jgi:L-asparaginase II
MQNPVLVDVLRGGVVESRHRGAIALVDADGFRALAIGDVEQPVYPRSAVKALQALVLVESGAADRFGLTDQDLALACSSHNGEPDHVATAQRMLRRAGLDAAALRCGAHPPIHQPAALALARTGTAPSALHNNCSGKHSGFLCVACALGVETLTYLDPDLPVQCEVRATIENVSGATLPESCRGIDGCSAPTWAMPLHNLAFAFARFGTGHGLAPERAKAAARLRRACMSHPWHVAGTGRLCTDIMRLFGDRVFVKMGAEGVYCAAFPESGLGAAVKCDDGAGRAAEVIMAALIARFVKMADGERTALERFLRPTLHNWNGLVIGALRPTKILSSP